MLLHKRKKRLILAASMILPGSAALQAAPVDIVSLDMSKTSLDLNLDGKVHSFSTTRPVSIIMGAYQNPIVNMTDIDGDTVSIYTTGSNPTPSGTADATLGTLDVNFTAMLADFTLLAGERGERDEKGNIVFTSTLWDNTTKVNTNIYNGSDNTFKLGWTTDIDASAISGRSRICAGGNWQWQSSCKTHIKLKGKVNVVPVPAAVWLFGSGLLGLIGISRRGWSR